jgi:hypothetical protein
MHRKVDAEAAEGFFAAEAWGLRWLGETRTVAVVDVLDVTDHSITVAKVPAGAPDAPRAVRPGPG